MIGNECETCFRPCLDPHEVPAAQASPTLSLSAWRLSAFGVTVWCVSPWGFTCAFFIPFLVTEVLELGSRYAILCPRVKPTSIAKVFGLRPSYSFNTTAPDQLVIDCNHFMGSRQLPSTETLHNFGPVDVPPADFHHTRGHWEARD